MTNDFFRFEDKEYDFPLLNGDSRFTTKNVIILLIGFLIGIAIPFIIPPTGDGLLKAILLTVPSLLAVVYVFKDDMSNIFRMPKLRDIIIIIIGFILMFVFAIIANFIGSALGITIMTDSAVNGPPLILIIRAVIQLLGEELLKFIPLIIVAAYLYKSIGRKAAIIVAVIISQIIFALFHIPAYGFAMGFLLVHIGFGSIVLPLVYVKTKNIVLCYLIHFFFDLWTFIPHLLGM
ncbi:CPBP family intramembrane glutamic endopeptidase [Methanobrevibacter sp.]|uniref:CPBP family intramembrane glutamic endopeptidase n=1 Tax=Methanobrevibacter sp. TaxID=66852 RepID=UPI0038639E0B